MIICDRIIIHNEYISRCIFALDEHGMGWQRQQRRAGGCFRDSVLSHPSSFKEYSTGINY